MSLARSALLQRLCFPKIWNEKGLYPEDLYQMQLDAFVADARKRGIPPDEYRPGGGTEHYRYGAFNYWLRREVSREILEALMEAAVADPDPPMAGAAIKDLLAAHHPTRAMLELAIQAVRRSKGYFLSEKELRARIHKAEGEDD